MTMTIAAAMALCVGAQAQTMPAGSALPRLMRFSGTAKDTGGNPVTGVTGITFALYAEQTGGAPLWSETQNVPAGPGGHYTVLLGAAKSEGLPADLFTAEQAHWVGVSVEGQAEQPRILLVSAPYALKAGDAETLGGLPPAAFLLAAAPGSGGHAESASASPAGSPAVMPTVGGTGTADYVPLWTDSSGDLGDSAMFQSGSGSTAKIGINTTTPASTLDVAGGGTIRGALTLPSIGKATATAGENSEPLILSASVFNSATSNAVAQTFQWQAEPVGNDTTSFSGSLNLLFGNGKATPTETGLSIASDGQIAFAAGQTFPGAGTITGVTAGTDLTGGGAKGAVTVSLDTTKVPQLAASNTFTGNQTVSGTVTATSFSGAGADITGVNASELGGSASSAYAQLAAANIFTQKQTINNTTIMNGTSSAGVLQVTNTTTSGQAPAIVGITNSSAAFAVKGIVTATTGTEAGIFGSTASTSGYGVYGQGPYIGVSGTGAIGVSGVANVGGLSGWFRGGPLSVAGNGSNALTGDPGCGSGYAGIGFTTTSLSGCTNYALIGGPVGDTYVNSSGTAKIHFRSNNNELATIDNFGNVNVIGQSGGGNLTVAGQATISTANSNGALNVTNTLTSGTAPAVVGTTNSSGANGIKGIITATSGANAGIYGQTASPSGIGVYGIAVAGSSSRSQLVSNANGVAGDTNQTGGNAVVGTADNGTGGLFVNNSTTNDALIAINLADNKSIAFWAGGGPPTFGLCYIDTSGDLLCFGTKSAVVPVDHGERQVALYAVEAPENWFEDMGSGQLSNGAARVGLDAVFAQTVNTGIEYHVFLTPKGDCKGLYVSNESADSFEVHELGGGTSSVAFDYRIVAKRNGYENVRLADHTQTFERLQTQSAQMWRAAHKQAGTAEPLPHQANAAGRKP
jgi:hypothetical protein